MLDQLMRALTQQGFERLLLEVRPSNRSAVRLYQRTGFTEVGTRRGYYPAESGRREDAVVFARALTEVSTA
jgi:ribosomal-protein-alanine N-acetyltransferase